MSYRVAVSSTDGKVVNQHFGRTAKFWILEVENDGKYKCVDLRNVEHCCKGADHNDAALNSVIDGIEDCGYVLVSKIGDGARQRLEARNIEAYELPGIISESVEDLVKHLEIKKFVDSFVFESEG